MLVGHARTSTLDQDAGIEAQKRGLLAAGCQKLFFEQVSAVGRRQQLDALVDFVREDDAVAVTRLDRLARSVGDLLNIAGRPEAKHVSLTCLLLLALVTALTACAPTIAPDAHVPPFARVPYEPISRTSVVAVALREWRLFGSPVDDDPPGSRPPPAPYNKPEREEGLWQRVGEYWWIGMNAGSPEAAWTGKHDAHGVVFPANVDGDYAWSAAFVSYVMRIAGAAGEFPYSPDHSKYINIAKQMALGEASGWIIAAERPESYAPLPGDLICLGRGPASSLRYDDLPAGPFPGHCDIVVDTRAQGMISVVGGNVDDAVTLKHVPVTPDGKLANADGTILDRRYDWMVVLRLLVPASATPTS